LFARELLPDDNLAVLIESDQMKRDIAQLEIAVNLDAFLDDAKNDFQKLQ
jgi:hypothetical protein